MGDLVFEFEKLIEKCFIKIVIAACCFGGVEIIAPPVFWRVYGERLIFVILRKNFFSGFAAGPVIEIFCVSFLQAANQAAIGAVLRFGDLEEFVESFVFVEDFEFVFALRTSANFLRLS